MTVKRGIQTFKIEAIYRINKSFLLKLKGLNGWQFSENFIISASIKTYAIGLQEGVHRIESKEQ